MIDKKIKKNINIEEIKRELEENGYTIIKNIVCKEETDKIRDSFVEFVCKLNKNEILKKDDKKTWFTKDWPENKRGNIKSYGIGHCQALWDLRGDQNIIDVFEQLYKTKKLLTSFDGGSIIKPNLESQEIIYTSQHPDINTLTCYQGIFNMEDSDSFIVYKKSHKLHKEYFEENKIGRVRYNLYTYSENDIGKNFIKKFERIKICCEKGDLILFDSKIAYSIIPNKEDYIITANVCMLPLKYAGKNDMKKKKKYFKNKKTTNHWPCKFLSCDYGPRWRLKDFYTEKDEYWKKNLSPILTNRMKQLAGLINY